MKEFTTEWWMKLKLFQKVETEPGGVIHDKVLQMEEMRGLNTEATSYMMGIAMRTVKKAASNKRGNTIQAIKNSYFGKPRDCTSISTRYIRIFVETNSLLLANP